METRRDWPEIEYLDGRPYPKVSPKRTHSFVQGALLVILRQQAGKLGEWVPSGVFASGMRTIPRPSLYPTLHISARSDCARLRPRIVKSHPLRPTSPSKCGRRPVVLACVRRRSHYLATGAKIVLDVDPATRLIHVHDAEGVRTLACGQRFTHPEALWLAFDVSEAFADLDDTY
jgi:hypothetical protein